MIAVTHPDRALAPDEEPVEQWSRDSGREQFRMTRLQGIRTRYEELVLADRNPQRMTAVIDFMFSRPILTLRQLESALDMPYMAAKRYVDKLVEAGVLQETTGYARNRVFMAYEIFQALENSE